MRVSKTCGEPCAVCDGCLEAHDAETVKGFASVIAQQAARVAELEGKLADAESMTLGAFDAALANGEERDSEKVRREAAEARVDDLEAKNAEWEQKARNWMATPEAAKRLDGYREAAHRINVLGQALRDVMVESEADEPDTDHIHEIAWMALAGRKEG